MFLWTTNWERLSKAKSPARLVELELERSKGCLLSRDRLGSEMIPQL